MGLQDGWYVDRAANLRGVGSGYVAPVVAPRFLATAYTAADGVPEQIIISSDGITWTHQALPDGFNELIMAAKGDVKWVVASQTAPTLNPIFARSTNGITWSNPSNPDFHVGSCSLAYGNSTYVIGGLDDFDGSGVGKFMYSPDQGLTWTLVDRDDDRQNVLIAYGNSIFLAVSPSSVRSEPPDLTVPVGEPVGATVQTSADGITWTAAATPASLQNVTTTTGDAGNWVRLRYLSDGKFWIVGYEPPHAPTLGRCLVAHSVDGTTWTEIDMGVEATRAFPNDKFPMDIAYDGTGNYVVPCRDDTVLISSDGTTWTEVNPGASTHWNSVAYGAGKFVIVGEDVEDFDNQVIGYSSDGGATWTIVDAPIGFGTDVELSFLNLIDVEYG